MSVKTKRIIALVAASIALLGAIYCLLRFGFSIDPFNRSGWHEKNGTTQYWDYFGRPHTGWQYIDEKLYYFHPDTGNMITGWQEVEGSRYYMDASGVRATGWLKTEDATYYLGQDGKAVTGWQVVDGERYLFTDKGTMATGWQVIDGHRSYLSDAGVALTGWQTLEGKRYYFDANGYMVSDPITLEGITYRFDKDGSVLTGWFTDDTGKYYLDEEGKPHTGWLELNEKRYCFNENGLMTTGWVTDGNDRLYLYEDGTYAVGRVEIEGKTHFFSSKGKWVLFCNPWNPVPEDFEIKLVSIEGFRFDSVGRDSLQALMDACRAAGHKVTINNSYRSKATQQYMWNKSVNQYIAEGMTKKEAEAETGKSTAIPGHSEHQTGLAVDLNGSDETYAWLAEHCWDYGFILRYPDDKIEITGIIYEPWHFRYVGTELALELKELGVTMEEYFHQLTPKTEEQSTQ